MSASTEPNDDAPAQSGVVERLDRARSRVKAAARKAQEQIAPTLERATESAESAKQQAVAAGEQAVAKVKRNPWAAGLALAGLGIGAFLLIRSPARARVLSTAAALWGRYGGQDRLRDLASRVDLGRLGDARDDLVRMGSRMDLNRLGDVKDDLARLGSRVDVSGFADKVRDQLRRLAA